jgi:hypothetical protein
MRGVFKIFYKSGLLKVNNLLFEFGLIIIVDKIIGCVLLILLFREYLILLI